jgi:hypothetical protein
MKVFFLWMVLSHTLADFYFQNKRLSDAKRNSARFMLLHCLIYAVTIFIPACLLGFLPAALSGALAAALGAAHFIVDSGKQLANRRHNAPLAALLAFAADQALHIVCLAAAGLMVEPFIAAAPWIASIPGYARYMKGAQLLAALLAGCTPAAVLVKLVLDTLPVPEPDAPGSGRASPQDADAGGGRLIGILERETIILLVFQQQFAAIGFILAAKSIARYKQLEQQPFAEKYLVGTLTSVLTALAASLALGQLR